MYIIDDRATVQPFSLFFNARAGVAFTSIFRHLYVFSIQYIYNRVVGHPALTAHHPLLCARVGAAWPI